MKFIVDAQDAGMTVLSYLKSKLKISTSALASLKRVDMGICVNEKHVTVRYVLGVGDILTIKDKDTFADVNETVEPHSIPLDIILENDELFVINKPPFMPTHPSHNHTDDTLANALAYIYLERSEPLVFRPIGRLDRNTSGISLIAKSSISASFLHYARTHGLMQKKYIALLDGIIADDKDWHITETNMKRTEGSVIVRCVSLEKDPDSFIAITRWRVLYSDDRVSLVEAIPETGRTHQLRVHFSHLGHSILGDDIYGEESNIISRHALHAYSLSLPMPYGKDVTAFTSMPPEDMQRAFTLLTGEDMNKYIQA